MPLATEYLKITTFHADPLYIEFSCIRKESKVYIPSTLNIDLILWQTPLIVCAVKC